MKTLKVEAVYPMAFEAFDDVIDHLHHFIEDVYKGSSGEQLRRGDQMSAAIVGDGAQVDRAAAGASPFEATPSVSASSAIHSPCILPKSVTVPTVASRDRGAGYLFDVAW